MIEELIKKYEKEKNQLNKFEKCIYIDLENNKNKIIKRDLELYEKILQDLEEIKTYQTILQEQQNEIDKKSLLAYLDYGCGSHFELGSQHEDFLENIKEYLGVDKDE